MQQVKVVLNIPSITALRSVYFSQTKSQIIPAVLSRFSDPGRVVKTNSRV